MLTSYRTVALWMMLIALFGGLYFFVGAGAHPSATASEAFQPWWSNLVTFLPLLVIFAVVILFLRRGSKGARSNQEGIALLNQGRMLQAAAKFELAASQLGANSGIAHFNLGVCRLSLWQLEQAVTAFEHARQTKTKLPPPRPLALAQALLGRLEVARRLVGERGDEPAGLRAVVLAVLAAREGALPEAFELASQVEVKQLGGMHRALAETLRAWARSQAGDRWPVDRIALFGEAGPGGLQAAWPELAAFVEQAP